MIFLPTNLRFLRESKGLTQGKLAEMIGVKPNTISNYETGNSSPDFQLLGMLLKILEADAHSFLFTDLREEGARPNRVSDVQTPYYGGRKDDGEGVHDAQAEVLAEYEVRLERMSRDIDLLKEAVSHLLERTR